MKYGFVKVAAVTPKIKVADTKYNGQLIRSLMKDTQKNGAKIVVFPELFAPVIIVSPLPGFSLSGIANLTVWEIPNPRNPEMLIFLIINNSLYKLVLIYVN